MSRVAQSDRGSIVDRSIFTSTLRSGTGEACTVDPSSPLACVVAIIALALQAGCGPPKELVSLTDRFEPLHANLQKVGKAYPSPSSYEEAPCPSGQKPLRIMLYSLMMLAYPDPAVRKQKMEKKALGPFVSHRGIITDRNLWARPKKYLEVPETMQPHQSKKSIWRMRQRELERLKATSRHQPPRFSPRLIESAARRPWLRQTRQP